MAKETDQHDISEQEKKIFRTAMDELFIQRSTQVAQLAVIPPSELTYSRNPDYLLPEQTLSFHRGNSRAALKKLKKRRADEIQAELDLHGLLLPQAAEKVSQAIARWQRRKVRLARIIHGKGKENEPSIIKAHIPRWLQSFPCVSGYASCPPAFGGNGAVLVLLKSSRYAV